MKLFPSNARVLGVAALVGMASLTACGSSAGQVLEQSPDPSTPEAPASESSSGASGGVSAELGGVEVRTFMYQIQELDDPQNIDRLAETTYDMLVVEPGFNFTESPYDVTYLVQELQTKPNGEDRLLLAYIDIGQAEDYRDYWGDDWVAPSEGEPGTPSFLVTSDPDGWEGNYPVAYWHAEWQELWVTEDGLIAEIARQGFDGVYLDWVEAYDDDQVRASASNAGVSPEDEMMLFIERIGQTGTEVDPEFLVIAQNAPYLLDSDPARYVAMIDGLATEDTWFYGEGDAEWDSLTAGDLVGGERHDGDYSTAARIAQNKRYLELGLPVFTIDYSTDPDHASQVYESSRQEGFVPLVTRVSLSQITETPPEFDQ